MIFADVRLPGAMDGIDLAWEVKARWPRLLIILTSGQPPDRGSDIPPGVTYMPKPWSRSSSDRRRRCDCVCALTDSVKIRS